MPEVNKVKFLNVSVIVPCRNEGSFIRRTIESLISQDYPKDYLEIILIDGQSTDNTLEIIKVYQAKNNFIKTLENPQKIVPCALNYGIKASSGDVIIRIDAHSLYPENYVSELVKYLLELNVDNVGGVWITKPGSNSLEALGIAEATSSIFGIGDAQYRLKNSIIRQVDTVPFGCYKREVFDKIGFFDEDLIRNQDDEFNARLINAGGKIYLIPSIKIQYFARSTIMKMSKMFYQYGLFKPLVNKKIGKVATIRQLFPVLFVIGILTFVISFFLSSFFVLITSVPLFIYLGLSLFFTIKLAIKNKKIQLFFFLPLIFTAIHLSYGMGYITGILKFLILKKKISPNTITISR